MKNFSIYKIFLALAALAAAASCTREIEVRQYIRMDMNSYTFPIEAEESFTVNIETSPEEWTAEITDGDDWVTISDLTDNSITFSATPNETGSMRHATATITAGEAKQNIVLTQLFRFDLAKFKVFDEFDNLDMNVVLSYNGRYAAGMDYYNVMNWETYEQTYHYTPLVIDLETGEVTAYDRIENRAISLKAVSDDGKTLLIQETFIGNWMFCNNEMTQLPFPDNFRSNDCYVDVMNADGNIVYGYGRQNDGWLYYPIKYTAGSPEVLPMAETDGHGAQFDPSSNGGNRVLGCSADGSVTYGVDQNTNRCVYWNAEGIHYVGDDVYGTVEGLIDMSDWGMGLVETVLYNQAEISFTATDRMSPNGKWIAMRYYDADIVDLWYDDYYRPVRFNTETGETEVFYDLENMSGLTCDDDGLMYLMTETPRTGTDITEADQTGYVFNPQTGDLVTCKDYVLREFGLTVPDIQIVRVASNGNILARTFLNDNGTMRAVQCLIMP